MTPDQNGIYITKKEASVSAAIAIILCLLIFIVGYFCGKKSVIDGFSQRTTQESFNDQVDYLLTMQSYANKNGTPSIFEVEDEPVSTETIKSDITNPTEPSSERIETKREEQPQKPLQKYFHAILIGFGKKASAQQFVNRLKKYNIDLEIKSKTSKSASGKHTKTWFQVVTKRYDSQQEVQDLVEKILRLENLKRSDIKII